MAHSMASTVERRGWPSYPRVGVAAIADASRVSADEFNVKNRENWRYEVERESAITSGRQRMFV
jgi:hypothetical protein